MSRDEEILFRIKPPTKEKVPGEILDVDHIKFSIQKYFVFMEGWTEYNYLTGWKTNNLKNNKKVELKFIQPRDSSNNARLLLEKAEECIKIKKSKINTNLDDDFNLKDITNDDKIRIIFDCDKNFDDVGADGITHAEFARKSASKNNFGIIFSNYSIEVWILCHFKRPTKNCKATNLIEQIIDESGWSEYKKNDPELFEKIRDKLDYAIDNADKLISEKTVPTFSKDSNPVTEMGLLIKEILSNV